MPDTVSAFVPLKANSQRVPGKNIRDFRGSPLFEVILGILDRCRNVGQIYVDTDSEEIADAAGRRPDVTVLWRKSHLQGDTVSVNSLIEDLLSERHEIGHVLQTHATNPLLTPQTIDSAVERYFAAEAESLFSVSRLQARCYDSNGSAINHNPSELLPTQDLDPVFVENSCIYVFSRASFDKHRHRLSSTPVMYEIDPLEAVDIDEEKDFELAARLYESQDST